MSKFVLTAQIALQAPKNAKQVATQIQKQLSNVNVPVNVQVSKQAQQQITNLNNAVKNTTKLSKQASAGMNKFERALGGALKQVFRYDIARAIINGFTNTIRDGIKDAIAFEKEMIKVGQVTGRSMQSLQELTRTISKLSVGLGVSSASLVKVSRVLAQTGMSAADVKVSLDALAKSSLAATFDDITNTTETAIAAMRQFKIEASGLEGVLGSINAVAGQFAVEASDIGVAIRRAGGAFKSAGGELNELIALFTAVRSTTRETAETIATGFRTIFTRMQRPRTIQFLKQFGVELQNLDGTFVGPFEAVKRLNAALIDLDPKDVRYAQIIEQLGGFRQVSKVIPLIQQFGIAQSALNVAQSGSASLAKDAEKAQEGLGNKITKIKEEFKELFRTITESTAFKALADTVLALAKALVSLADKLGPILPMLAGLGALKGLQFMTKGAGRMMGFNRGGVVPGSGNTDSVPAVLTPGEFVLRKSAVQSIGADRLHAMNKYAGGGSVRASSVRTADMQKRIVRRATGLNNPDEHGPISSKTQFNDSDTLGLSQGVRRYPIRFIDEKRKNPETGKITKTGYWRVIGGPPGGGKSRRVSKRMYPSPKSMTGAQFEAVLAQTGLMREVPGTTGGNQRFDGKRGAKWVEARSRGERTSNSIMMGKAYGQASIDSSIRGSRLSADLDRHKLSIGSILYENASKFNKGGGVAGSDTVPALLTPGEFVINKKSAQQIGYGNLKTMNNAGVKGYARGGAVGFNTGGNVGSGKVFGAMIALEYVSMFASSLGGASEKIQELIASVTSAVTTMGFLLVAIKSETAARVAGIAAEKIGGITKALKGGMLGKVPGVGKLGNALSQRMAGFSMMNNPAAQASFTRANQLGMAMKSGKTAGIAKQALARGSKMGVKGPKLEKYVSESMTKHVDSFGKQASQFTKDTVKLGKKFRNLIGVAGLLGVGVTMAANAVQDHFLKNIEETGGSDFDREMAVGSGIVSGAATGAAMGAILGPFGIAIGAAVGGVIGFMDATEAADAAMRAFKFNEIMKGFTTAIDDFLAGKATVGVVATKIAMGAQAMLDRFQDVRVGTGDFDDLNGQIKEAVPKLQQYINKVTASSQSFDQLKNTVGDQFLRNFATLAKIPFSKLKKQIEDQIKIQEKARKAQEAAAKAAEANTRLLVAANNLTSVFEHMSHVTASMGNSLENFGNGLDSFGGISNTGTNVAGATATAFNTDQFEQAMDNLVSIMGQQGADLAPIVKATSVVQKKLPTVLASSIEEIKAGALKGENPADIIIKRLESSMGPLPARVEETIRAKLGTMDLNTEEGQSLAAKIAQDAFKVSEELVGGLDNLVKPFQEAAKLLDQQNAVLEKAFKKRSELAMKISKSMQKETDLRFAMLKQQQQFDGKKITGAQGEANFQQGLQNTLFGGASGSVQGIIKGGTEGVNSPASLGQTLSSIQTQIAAKEEELTRLKSGEAAATGNLAAQQQQAASELAELKEAANRTKTALEQYTDVQRRVEGLQNDLAAAMEERKQKMAAINKLAFADDKGRKNQLKAMNAAAIAIKQGNLSGIPDDMRAAVGGVLDQFGSVKLAGGKTGAEIKNDIAIAELEQMLGRRLSQEEKEGFTKASQTEKQLQQQILQAHEEAIAAQEQLTGNLEQNQTQFLDRLAQTQARFIAELKQTLFTQIMEQANAEKVSAEGQRTTLKEQIAAFKELPAAFRNMDADKLDVVRTNMPAILAGKKAQGQAGGFAGALAQAETALDVGGGLTGGFSDAQQMAGLLFGGVTDLEDAVGKSRGGFLFGSNLDATQRDKFQEQLLSKTQGFLERSGVESEKAAMMAQALYQKVIGDINAKGGAMDLNDLMDSVANQLPAMLRREENAARNTAQAGMDAAGNAGLNFNLLDVDTLQAMSESLNKIPSGETFDSLNTKVGALDTKIASLTTTIANAEISIANAEAEAIKIKNAAASGGNVGVVATDNFKARGGLIYASQGAFIPRGTDTVPAMLTPGEFVMRRSAVKSIGVNNLRKMNSGKAQYLHTGGLVQGDGGGHSIDASMLTRAVELLDNSINRFSANIRDFQNTMQDGIRIEVGGTINVNVELDEKGILDAAQDALGDTARQKVEEGINDMLKKHFPQIARKNNVKPPRFRGRSL